MAEIEVEVAYASKEKQSLKKLFVVDGATVQEAILQSGILTVFPEINLEQAVVGVWGKKICLDTKLKAGDRVEIYRPLLIDPKEARRRKVQKLKLR